MINLAAAYCLSGRLEEALQCVDQGAALHEEFGDQMRVCDALIVRSEVKRRMGRLAEADADADLVLSMAEVWGYRFVAAASRSQRSRILRDLGEHAEAARLQAQAERAFAGLGRQFRDPLIEVLINPAGREGPERPGGVLAVSAADDTTTR